MSIANPLVISYNSVSKSLARINMDNYGSEYLLLESLVEYRVKIRHSKEKPTKTGVVFNRHNVELTYTVLPTSTTPAVVTQIYTVIRNVDSEATADLQYLSAAFVGFMTDQHVSDLQGWQS